MKFWEIQRFSGESKVIFISSFTECIKMDPGKSVKDIDSSVKQLVQKAHHHNEEIRKNKRLEAQSSKRNISKTDFNSEISDKEAKTLSNLCKSGKLSIDQFRELSQALSSKPEFSEDFMNSDGCLHALVGWVCGKDPPRQLLALQCLVNLSAQGYKCPIIAKAAGAYFITLMSGTNQTLAEFSCNAVSNLAMKDNLTVPILMNFEAVQTLLNLAQTSSGSLQESALQGLYHLTKTENMTYDLMRQLTSASVRMLDARPPIHLVWLLYSLSSNQTLHNFLANRNFLHQCVDIATYEIFQKCDSRPLVKLLTPVIRILANLSAGPDSVSVCLCLVRHPDFPAILTALLSTNYLHLCKESLWLFANIVNNESVTVQEEFVNLDLMDKLETHAIHAIGRLDPYALA